LAVAAGTCASARAAGHRTTLRTCAATLEGDMADLIYIVLAIVFFALSWGLVRLAERL
jgi:hypothetical protein